MFVVLISNYLTNGVELIKMKNLTIFFYLKLVLRVSGTFYFSNPRFN